MSELSRRRAFAVAALAVICAVGLAAALSSKSSGRGASSARDDGALRPTAAWVVRTSATNPEGHGGAPRSSARALRPLGGARKAAHPFVGAFLLYESDAMDHRTRSLLARAASTRVRRYLISAAPRASSGVPSGQVRSLRLYEAPGGRTKASAVLRYGGRLSLLEFLLERGAGEWPVSELYP